MDLLDRLPCGVLTFDEDGKVVFVNETLLRMLDRERDEIVSHHLDVILPKGGRIFLQTHFIPLLTMHGRLEEVYFELQKRSGEKIPVLINAARRSGEPSLTDCVLVTVTQRGRYEKALLDARREAERANQTKAKFLSIVAHDLRTPLQAISGYAEALAREFHGPLTDGQKEDVESIRSGSRDLARLIDDVLSFATLQSGRIPMILSDVPVADALARADRMVALRMEEKDLEFNVEEVDQDAVVRADADRLQQILLNLLTNALKFTPAGGAITVSFHEKEDEGSFLISDTGKGIPPDMIESIFDPFTQIEGSGGDPTQRGVGLGLAISRELARAMDGELSAQSTPGKGSTFRLDLPMAGRNNA